ncbi:flagellar basal body rod protein FlgF [Rosenbergiella australiborealis]|uniref:flagellar basal body rod protein FlgF n=1 Tax=Rosenbergiella australiborealis TaxID=1544696 RepID=UPI001F4E88A5|nr:flagellar basal body rod protein FlgF [Rosenbergiella australiborealis]
MDRMIYTALSGANQTLALQAVTANNLANVSTPGFKAQLANFRSVPIAGTSLATRSFVSASTPGADFTPGRLISTERTLDVALSQNNWLAVTLPDGGEAYTRNGSLQISAQGNLTLQGYPVVGEGGAITIPEHAQLSLAPDGTITALNAGDSPNATVSIGRLKIAHAEPSEIARGEDGLFRLSAKKIAESGGGPLPNDPQGRVMAGMLEESNVNPVQAMVTMINHARRFEMQMKEISHAEQNEQKANQLLSLTS